MSALKDRFRQLIEAKVPEDRRFRYLAEVSGIGFESWRKAFNGGQRPTAEMLEFLGQTWPEHAFWLTTGCTDNRNGHCSPDHRSEYDAGYEPRPSAVEFLRLQVKLRQLSTPTAQTVRDRWNDRLTEIQERNVERFGGTPFKFLFSVHPELAQRKKENKRRAQERDDEIDQLMKAVELALRKREAEARAIYGDQEG